MRVRSVVIGRVDIEIGRTTDVVCQIGQDRRSRVAAPVPVPDVVYVCGPQYDGTAMIGDATTPRSVRLTAAVSISVLRMIQSIKPLAIGGDILLLGADNPD